MRFRPVAMTARAMIVEGRVERLDKEHAPRPLHPTEGEPGPAMPIIHVVAHRLIDASTDIDRLSDSDVPAGASPVDGVRPTYVRWQSHRHPRDVRTVPNSRDFH